ncbi:MAG: L-fucose/L-arabinose isomerase family protein [Phycisphaerae bacterium]|nr:L-fucose/L-arabinose isomerase family protein [Phycisphaerae bacterium]
MHKTTFGVIIGNRGFFPDVLAKDGRKNILEILEKSGFGSVTLSMNDTKFGAVETFSDAKKCAEKFAYYSNEIDGIIVTLPNFGDEKGIVESIKRSGLKVPVLIHAESDNTTKMTKIHRRDSFCGKISVCNNLNQAGIPYTLTKSHTVSMNSEEFDKEIHDFAAICRVVKGLKNARFGAIGARTGAFNTVRYSEKLLEANGIAVETIDLSEILGLINKLDNNDQALKQKLQTIKKYVNTANVSSDSLLKMAKFGLIVENWMKDMELDGSAIQCWTSLQEFFGIMPCTIMSMMSESLLPSACEVDIAGLLAMYILQQASLSPSAILDWNNNFGEDQNKCVLFHCSNLAKSFFESAKMDYNTIIGSVMGQECSYGTISGKIRPGQATYCRISTFDKDGCIAGYVGEGEFTNDKVDTFGGYGVMEIPNLQELMQVVCRKGFEHHVAVNISSYAEAIEEALKNYMGWNIYRHK